MENMQEFSIFANYKTDPNGSVVVAWHNFWLFDSTDGWYGAGGAINLRQGGTYIDPTGTSGKFVGSELDLTYNRKLNANSSISFGVAFFSPGSFIKNVNPSQDKNQVWGYGMLSMKF
ncbi:MAG: alginate export family protein [Fimbriimonadaceae bacterium]